MNAVNLYRRHSMDELVAMAQEIRDDPKNANPEHAAGRSINLYTKQARRKLDAIAYAIYYHQQDRRSA